VKVRRQEDLLKMARLAERNFLTGQFFQHCTDAKGVIQNSLFNVAPKLCLVLHRCRSGKQHQTRRYFPTPQELIGEPKLEC